jgi:cytochrome c oxidase cbb3-type subunit 3
MRRKSTLVIAAALTLGVVAARVGAQGAPQTPAAPAGQTAPQGAPGAGRGAAPAGQRGGNTFPAQQRPPADPAIVAKGKTLYGINCQSCHGVDLRGGDMGGPNLLRSDIVLRDQNGELISPIVKGSRAAAGMDPINMSDPDIVAVAVYIHSVAATMQGQGGPPRGNPVPPNEAVLVGNIAAGQAYFAAKCASCHSVTGDLAGIGGRILDPRMLQTTWVSGNAGRGGGRGGTPTTVTVTMPNGQKVEGELARVDDFIVIVRLADGTTRTIARNGDVPKVDIKDPGEAHRKMWPTITDKDMHDVTAYLASIK